MSSGSLFCGALFRGARERGASWERGASSCSSGAAVIAAHSSRPKWPSPDCLLGNTCCRQHMSNLDLGTKELFVYSMDDLFCDAVKLDQLIALRQGAGREVIAHK